MRRGETGGPEFNEEIIRNNELDEGGHSDPRQKLGCSRGGMWFLQKRG